jgi:suppressor of fused
MTPPDVENEFSGWDSIDEKLAQLYPGVEPIHYGTLIKWSLGGPDPLDGLSIFSNPGPPEHWHYVSYGLTELYEKETDSQEYSGFGFELTFRLAREAGETQPPTWPMALMQNLARYVFESGNVFDQGHRLPLNSPILQGSDTLLCGAMFAIDPQLGQAESCHGRYSFLQIIGTTDDELDAAEAWNTRKFIGLLATDNPLMVTTLARRSILDDAKVSAMVKEETEKDGSSCDSLYVLEAQISEERTARASELNFRLRHQDLTRVRRLIAGRLLHGRKLALVSPDSHIVLVPAKTNGWKREESGFVINMSARLAQEIVVALDSGDQRFTFDGLKNFVIATKQ